MEKEKLKEKFVKFHDKNYKILLLIPAILLISGFIYMGIFYSQHHDFIYRDISLTGGTSVTINNENINPSDLKNAIMNKLEGVNIREISDLMTKKQIAIIIETRSDEKLTREVLEDYLGYKLDEKNSSFEFTGSALSESFYSQLMLAILLAFTFMGTVVFFLFSKNMKLKILLTFLSLITPLLFFVLHIPINQAFIIAGIVLSINLFFYVRYNIPSMAIILSAFADIFMTLVLLNILKIPISGAGIVALLMLIGYSVDTDILLTNKVLKREEKSLNRRIFEAFKTGITMTLTSLFAVLAALIIVGSFSSTLSQIFTIMSIGLGFDLLNTWLTNVSIIKWYVSKKEK
jgi:preprotein translocase subunit SecF